METTLPVGPKKYSVWSAMPLSFFSGELYRDVARNWKGTGFGYMFLILLLGWIPAAVKIHLAISKGLHEQAPEALKQVPDFKIQDGKFSIKVKQPYFMPNRKKPEVIIDTTGKITSFSQVPAAAGMDSVILVTKTKMITRRNRLGAKQDQTLLFSQLGPFTIDKKALLKWSDILARMAGFLIYPFAVAAHFIYNIIAILVYALIGLLLASLLKVPLKYEALIRLAAVSHTPALLLSLIVFFVGVKVPHDFLAYFVFSTAVLFLTVRANRVGPPVVPGTV
jgi:hypothetical protein